MKVETGNGTVQEMFVWPSSEECRHNPHRPDCKNRPEEPIADEDAGYADSFCECHDFPEPLIHANETDISWPAGWDQKMAAQWRKENGLSRPNLQN
jgi:hypothetical protein